MQWGFGWVPPDDIIPPSPDGKFSATTLKTIWQIELFMEEANKTN